eukprot:jgi/Botrbrau1/806/Bobra.0352s0003.1
MGELEVPRPRMPYARGHIHGHLWHKLAEKAGALQCAQAKEVKNCLLLGLKLKHRVLCKGPDVGLLILVQRTQGPPWIRTQGPPWIRTQGPPWDTYTRAPMGYVHKGPHGYVHKGPHGYVHKGPHGYVHKGPHGYVHMGPMETSSL